MENGKQWLEKEMTDGDSRWKEHRERMVVKMTRWRSMTNVRRREKEESEMGGLSEGACEGDVNTRVKVV